MTKTHAVYRAAHCLPDGPYSEAELAELLMSLFHIVNALPEEYRPHLKAPGAYEYAWNQIHDRTAAE